ncbi:MAG: hydroxyethylthiazole kinase, partial [Desulfurococcales archaeon]|nr:hydroxyethylthiazole kinase [Desulfurococcales archaeon]
MDWIGEAIEKVRKKRPLVHNITNYVVMNTTAN